MLLPCHGFYTRMVHVKDAELITDVFESCGVGGHLGELETAHLQASGPGPLGTRRQQGSLAGCWGDWQDSANSWCLATLNFCKHHLLPVKK